MNVYGFNYKIWNLLFFNIWLNYIIWTVARMSFMRVTLVKKSCKNRTNIRRKFLMRRLCEYIRILFAWILFNFNAIYFLHAFHVNWCSCQIHLEVMQNSHLKCLFFMIMKTNLWQIKTFFKTLFQIYVDILDFLSNNYCYEIWQ